MANPENKDLNDEIARMFDMGLGVREIARAKKLHTETVRRKLILRGKDTSRSAVKISG